MLPHDTPLRGLPLAVIDVETTGLDPAVDQVVSVAVAHLEIGESAPRLAFSSLVNPGRPIPPDATRIHGITDADVADAPPWSEVQARVVEACAGRLPSAFNALFDARFVPALPWPWGCLMVLARAIDKYQTGRSLSDVARRRRIELDAHGAAGDALTAALLTTPLFTEHRTARDKYKTRLVPDLFTLGDWLTWQDRAGPAQERDWCAYRSQQGARGPRPDCPWHTFLGLDLPPWTAPQPTYRLTQDGRVVPVGEAA